MCGPPYFGCLFFLVALGIGKARGREGGSDVMRLFSSRGECNREEKRREGERETRGGDNGIYVLSVW